MNFLEFLNNDGLDELTSSTNISLDDISFRLTLDFPCDSVAQITAADAMKFLHMIDPIDNNEYILTIKNSEELLFIEQAFAGKLSYKFKIGGSYRVMDFGLFIGL